MTRKILFVFGTRPEAIKLAPLIREFKKNSSEFITRVCTTGQHKEMLKQTLNVFNLKPDIELGVMKVGQNLSVLTSEVIVKVNEVLDIERPDVVIVHGDTTSTLSAAMACFYAQVPVAHIEAGLRSYDLSAPFPEEFNRKVVGKLATWHLAPTSSAKDNLLQEGILSENILVVGNTVIDALLWASSQLLHESFETRKIKSSVASLLPFDIEKQKYVLITGHRRENFGNGIKQICSAIRSLSETYSKIHFIYPVHLNPKINEPVKKFLSGLSNVHLVPPQDYLSFVYLLKYSHLVLTDSGGIQEEAPSLGKPVLVMRSITERPEGVHAGTSLLVGTSKKQIILATKKLLDDPEYYKQIANTNNPYGDGKSSKMIYEFLGDKVGK